ncbi:MAG: gliding motility-associated C-terminal domain-containing protein [Candidatus Zixiibacteriota bacterium]
MKNLRIAAFAAVLILLFVFNLYSSEKPAYIVDEMRFNAHGAEWDFDMLSPMEYTTDLGCRLDTGAVDIVFCFDTSGSMGSEIADVRSSITGFVTELDARGYDYRLGGLTFGDGTNLWDADPGTPGFQMYPTAPPFIAQINATGVWGGGDWPETPLDAICDAIRLFDWRPDAMHVLLIYTDAGYHESNWASDETVAGTRALILSTGTVVFFAENVGGAVGAVYTSLAESSGGARYPLSSSWADIFDDIIEMLTTWEAINTRITNATGVTCAINAHLIPNDASCVSVISTNPITSPTVSPGGSVNMGWHVDIDSSCTGSSRCFNIRLWGCGGEVDTVFGCTTDDSCRCVGPEGEIQYPLPCGVITACDYQEMRFRIWDDDSYVDPTSIHLIVDGVHYYYPDHMTYIGDILTFTPTTPWTHGSTVSYTLAGATDIEGCPMFGSPTCNFQVDLEPPALVDISPECETLLEDTVFSGEWDITDDVAGIDVLNSYFTVNGVSFPMSSPHVDFTGTASSGTFSIDGTFRQLGFYSRDTAVVCLHPQDQVSSSFCGPNDTTYCCTFYLNQSPYAYFVYPGLDSITACNPDSILLVINDPDGLDNLDPATFRLNIDGTIYSVSSSEISWTDSFLVFHAPHEDFWADGDTVEAILTAGTDVWGSPIEDLPIEWSFVIDYRPPILMEEDPLCGTLLTDTVFHAEWDVEDSVSGIATDEAYFTINGIRWDLGTHISFDGSSREGTYSIDGNLGELGFYDADTIEVCLFLHDMPHYCGPNDTFYCCEYYLNDPPYAYFMYPGLDSISACNPESIVVIINDTDGLSTLRPSTFELEIDGVVYTTSDPEITWTDSFLVFHGDVDFWEDGDTVECRLLAAEDQWGISVPDLPIEWHFVIDYRPPLLLDIDPMCETLIGDSLFHGEWIIEDSVSGIDFANCYFTVNGTVFDLESGRYSYTGTPREGTLMLDGLFSELGIWGSDTIEMCLTVMDMPDYCGVHDTTYCCTYYLNDPPYAYFVYPEYDSITACNPDSVVLVINDPDGVDNLDPSTFELEVDDILYTIDSPELHFRDSFLVFVAPYEDFWADGDTVRPVLTDARDLWGYPVEDLPIEWRFIIDYHNPLVLDISKPCGSLQGDSLFVDEWDVIDSVSGIDWESCYFTIEGATYPVPSEHVSYVGDVNEGTITLSGTLEEFGFEEYDTALICLTLYDQPSYCAPHDTTICCDYWFNSSPWAYFQYPEYDSITACNPDSITLIINDYEDNLDTNSFILSVDGELYDLTDTELYWHDTTLVFLAPEVDFWEDGDTVHAELVYAADTFGYPVPDLPIEWQFVIDYVHPYVLDYEPLCETIIGDTNLVVAWNATDSVSGVDYDDCYWLVNGTPYYFDHSFVSYADSGDFGTFFLEATFYELGFFYFDTVEICLYLEDQPSYCEPNDTTYCCELYINGPPYAYFRYPGYDSITACNPDSIVFIFNDLDGNIEPSTVILEVDGVSYDMLASEMSYHDDSVFVFFPTEPDFWEDGDTVVARILEARDYFGVSVPDLPIDWQFVIDYQPPLLTSRTPECDSILGGMISFQWELYDSVSGINFEESFVRVNDTLEFTYGSFHYAWEVYDSNSGRIDFSSTFEDLGFGYFDTVEICLGTHDKPHYCGPNDTLYCCEYYINGPPYGYFLYPGYDSITACNPDSIVFIINDADTNLDPSTVVIEIDGALYNMDSPMMSYHDDTVFVFTAPYPDFWMTGDTVEVAIVEAYDVWGTLISDAPIEWEFVIDYAPPYVVGFWPLEGDIFEGDMPTEAMMYFHDLVSGFDPDGLYITVNGDSAFYTGEWMDTLGIDSVYAIDIALSMSACFGTGDTCIVEVCAENIHDMPDYCAPNVTDYCWTFELHRSGPAPEIVYPSDETWVACQDSTITMYIDPYEDTDISSESARLSVDGVLYTTDSTQLELVDGEWLVFNPGADYWTDGYTYHVSLDSISDIYGTTPSSLPIEWEFYTDFTPPIFGSIVPSDRAVVSEESPVISFDIEDSGSGTDLSSIEMNIGDSLFFGVDSSCITWDAATGSFELNTECAGITFIDEDIVEVCISAYDSPDYCDPNDSTYCWDFEINLSPPASGIIAYPHDSWVACVPGEQHIILSIIDDDGIDESTIVFEVDGTEYHWGDPELSWEDDSILIFEPVDITDAFADAETISVCLLEAADVLGNPMEDSLCWYFMMDLSAPDIWEPYPLPDTILNDSLATISIRIHDSLSGLDESSIYIEIEGETYTIDSSGITWMPGESLLVFDIESIGESWDDFDTIDVHVEACDMPDTCGPNCNTYDWTFYVHLSGPEASILTPRPGWITACENNCILMTLEDDFEGVDDTTIMIVINETDTFGVDDDALNFDETAGILEFCPESWRLWADEESVWVELIAADDTLGNPLATPLEWGFAVDLSAPEVSGIMPEDGDTVTMLYPVIELDITDNLSGVDPASILLNVDGIDYTIDSSAISWTHDEHIRFASDMLYRGGDSVQVCFHAEDSPDTCAANYMDTCWVFYIEAGGPFPRNIRPFNGMISSCTDEHIIFTLEDSDGIIDTSIHFYVLRSSDMSDTSYLDLTSPDVSYSYDPIPDPSVGTVEYYPTAAFFDPETVYVCITNALDSILNPMSPPEWCWEFYMDQTPPEIWDFVPAEGEIVATRTPAISFRLYDYIAGLDSNSVTVDINGTTADLTSPCITFTEPESLWNVDTDCLGLSFSGGDSVWVTVSATDSTDSCTDNYMDTTWYFTIETGGPEAEIIRPGPGDTSSCFLEYIAIRLWDANGIDESTIELLVDGETIYGDDTRLSYESEDSMLFFVPDPVFDDIDYVHVELLACDDSLGNPLATPLSWDFVIDRVPPEFWAMEPIGETPNPRPRIRFNVADTMAGVNWDSVSVEVWSTSDASVTYTLTDAALTRVDTTVIFDPTEVGRRWYGGDTVCVNVRAVDLADDFSGDTDWEGEPCPPNSYDSTWCFTIMPGGPVATLFDPYANGLWDACDPDTLILRLTDDETVIDSTIEVEIRRPDIVPPISTVYTTSDDEIYYDGVEFLYYFPDPAFENGEEVHMEVIAAEDSLGNELASSEPLTVYFDYTPPVVYNVIPQQDSTLEEVTTVIHVEMADSLSGIDPESILLTINGTDYGYSHPQMIWDGEELTFDTEEAGLSWIGGDSIYCTICVSDDPHLCNPHEYCFAWSFYIARGGPRPQIVRVEDSATSACPDEYVEMIVDDRDGIIESSIVLEVVRYAGTSDEGTVSMTTGSSQLSYDSRPNLIFTPDPPFINGETVEVCITAVEDSLHNPIDGIVCWSFSMDLQEPKFLSISPADSAVLLERIAPIEIELIDSLTGIDAASIELAYDHRASSGSSSETFDIGDDGIYYDSLSNHLLFSPESLGIQWTGGDSICIQLQCHDRPSGIDDGFDFDYCEPNFNEIDWCFRIAPGAPMASIMRPFDGAYSSCIDEHIEIQLTDNDVGVDPSTIILEVNGQSYTIDESVLTYEDSILWYQPDPPFADGDEIHVVLREAADYLGNLSTNLLDWTFYMDMTPPEFTIIEPPLEPGLLFMTRNKYQPITLNIYDGGSGIDDDDIVFMLNGEQYTTDEVSWIYDSEAGEATLTFDPENHGLEFGSNDTIEFSIDANDIIDYCADNENNHAYVFIFEPTIKCNSFPNPFTPNDDSYNDICMFDYPYMFTEDAHVSVFTKRKELVWDRNISASQIDQLHSYLPRSWDGRDNNGKKVRPGVYIYIITKDGELVCEGTISLIR